MDLEAADNSPDQGELVRKDTVALLTEVVGAAGKAGRSLTWRDLEYAVGGPDEVWSTRRVVATRALVV